MKEQLSYEDLRCYMEGWSDRIDDSRFITNCADGAPFRGWIEFQTSDQAKEFVQMLEKNYDLTTIGSGMTIVAFNYVDESTGL